MVARKRHSKSNLAKSENNQHKDEKLKLEDLKVSEQSQKQPSSPKQNSTSKAKLKPNVIHSSTVHLHCVPSPLSGDSKDQNFWGFMNLGGKHAPFSNSHAPLTLGL
jgi:hypothetical protein